jgi:aryl-alcohol dehydrogenase-like predicted oxidoreductase
MTVHTKLAPDRDPLRSLNTSLRKTRRKSFGVLYFHEELSFSPAQKLAIRRLVPLRGEKFSHLGASIYEEDELDRLLDNDDISAIQIPYNVMDQRFNSGRLADAKARGMAIYGRSILLQGVLVAPASVFPARLANLANPVNAFQDVCRNWNVSPLTAAILFAKANTALDGLVIGARSIRELDEVSANFCAETVPGLIHELGLLVPPLWPEVDPRKW